MLLISQLNIYPIKSLGGIKIECAVLTDRGFQHDRRFVLIDESNRFISQREIPKMALLQPVISGDKLFVFEKRNSGDVLELDLKPVTGAQCTVHLFKDESEGLLVSKDADKWFSEKLGTNCRLVYMPDQVRRPVDHAFAIQDDITSFSDGYPVLMIGESSLQDLNGRLALPLPMNRFRPNIVFAGGVPFEEDTMKVFEINGIHFYAVKSCARCVMTTIDQETAQQAKEPLKTLAAYRTLNKRICFGQNILFNKQGQINVGDELKVLERQPHLTF
ncbi:MOSC domain-containing protein [Niabella ginsengisoli]|uniref:MOSC domain-containing protein n=1 Tax=Niabella ginsengisoli TaxID=522298 RepID=A0ABS9SJR1_9BACT|nr:MOSC N-terminal beta barrel domain-containing protein [Niabella ginsengisoli]MCH5598555.1 MOSC domain-containing protein [Niabella ginsengisoli]